MKQKEIWPAPELYKELLQEESKKRARPVIKSGFSLLDYFIQDFAPGELTILSGKTGHGKSTLGISMTANMCEQGANVLWFSYEMGTFEFLKKTMDRKENVPGFFLPYELIPNNLKYIEFKIQECKKEYALDVVFLDHLHYLCDLKDMKLTLEIGRVMRWLKSQAIRNEIVVFLISHIQKMADFKLKDLDNDHLRDSSFTAQEADNVFFIVRDDKSDNEAVLKITKNRRYGYRNKYIKLVKIGNYLFEKGEEE